MKHSETFRYAGDSIPYVYITSEVYQTVYTFTDRTADGSLNVGYVRRSIQLYLNISSSRSHVNFDLGSKYQCL